MSEADFDLCVIGGGINGAGIARDAAGRGSRVLLVEAEDLAGATSSASTKLIHGGLRYLEYYEFKLVREALREREILLNIAPHLVWPQEFILPHDRHLRPAWMIRAGLFLYDHLGGRGRLSKSHGVKLRRHKVGAPLLEKYRKGFSYADCRSDDSRLVVVNALDAQARGAEILTRTKCTGLAVRNGVWHVTINNKETKTAAKLVNAGGPWVHEILAQNNLIEPDTPNIRLVKGSHILVPRLYKGEHAYILQEPDKRIIFAIPYEHNYTMVGTTDENYEGDPRTVAISPAETHYLCDGINRFFKHRISPADVRATWSGVRPLLDDGHGAAQSVTRDFKLVRDDSHGAPLLSVFGGKITTYRILAEQAVDQLIGGKHWTAKAPLPGGNMPEADFEAFLHAQESHYPWLSGLLIERYARLYGTRMELFLRDAQDHDALGADYGDGLYEAEVRYLVEHEWARAAEDILKRRTKLYLQVTPETVANLERALPGLLRGAGV